LSAERPLLSISRKTLDEGPREVRSALPAAWLARKLVEGEAAEAVPYGASVDGAIDAWVTPAGGENFLVKGHVHATVDGTCGRCLGPARVPVDAQITLLLVPKAQGNRPVKGKKHKDSEGEFEFDADEADVEHYDGETVVLDDLVREAILLELPISPLCSEDCAGMGSDPAVADRLAQARVDPRLQKLAELRDKLPAGGQKK
jgi:uncharacterized protein